MRGVGHGMAPEIGREGQWQAVACLPGRQWQAGSAEQSTAGPILGRSHLHDTYAASVRIGSGHPRGTARTSTLACPRGFGSPLFSTLDSRPNLSDYTSGHVHAVPRLRHEGGQPVRHDVGERPVRHEIPTSADNNRHTTHEQA